MAIPILLAAAVAAMPTVPATDAASRAAVTAYIERCADEWAHIVVRFEPEVIRRCIADDYRGFSSGGKLVTKPLMLEPVAAEGKAAGLYYAQPRFISPTLSIAQGEEWWEPKDDAGKKHLIWNDIWTFRAGKWQIVASQDSIVPFDQPLMNRPAARDEKPR
jgi:hypothetical protein